jgi:hypothetical protein
VLLKIKLPKFAWDLRVFVESVWYYNQVLSILMLDVIIGQGKCSAPVIMTVSFQEALSRRHHELMIALRVWCKWLTIAVLQLELATANDCSRQSKTPLPAKDDECILYVCMSNINNIGIYGIHVTSYEEGENK